MVSPDDPITLWAIILTGVALTIWLECHYRWAESIGGPTLGLAIAAMLSNFHVMPAEANTYELSSLVLLPIAIPMLLVRASLIRIYSEAKLMLLAFLICCIGTVVGAVAAYLILNKYVEHSPVIAGVEAASNIGGSVNFVATREALALDPTIASGLLVVDNIVMVLVFLVLFQLANLSFFKRNYGAMFMISPSEVEHDMRGKSPFSIQVSIKDLALGLALAFAIAASGIYLAPRVQAFVKEMTPPSVTAFGLEQVVGNKYVLVSLISVATATIFRTKLNRLDGIQEFGVYLLYVYLFVLGLPANIQQLSGAAPTLVLFCLMIAGTNLLFALIFGKLCRIPAEPLLLTVNATIGGPSTAAAMAGSFRWGELVLPAMLIGLLGYAVATPIGISLGRVLLTWARG